MPVRDDRINCLPYCAGLDEGSNLLGYEFDCWLAVEPHLPTILGLGPACRSINCQCLLIGSPPEVAILLSDLP